MSLVFAAIVPHSPVLIPSIGREHLARLKKTTESLARLEQDLYASRPDTLLILSPHGPTDPSHFTLDFNDRYVCSLKEFGVFETSLACRVDMALANDLREHMEDRHIPFMLRSEAQLDYGTLVPLTYLAAHLPNIAILPVYPSHLDAKTHVEFGRAIQEVLMRTNRRVAVIASADLSHRLSESAPGGFSPSGPEFDKKVLDAVAGKSCSSLLNLDPKLTAEAEACGLPPLLILSGILDKIGAEPELLSYESPFGIGYAAACYRFA